MAYKTFGDTEILTATDLNGVVGNTIPRFASTTQRSAAIATPEQGQLCYVNGTGIQMFVGTAWKTLLLVPPGGTTGQLLAKTGDADGAIGWVTRA